MWCSPDGPAAVLGDVPDDVGVDLLGEHPRDDLERRLVGVAPALDEPGLEPRLLHGAVIALPPPWTTTGRMPTVSMKTMSTSRARSASGSSITLPPSLMTVNLPWNLRM